MTRYHDLDAQEPETTLTPHQQFVAMLAAEDRRRKRPWPPVPSPGLWPELAANAEPVPREPAE